jgi:hypothetical protein
LAQLVQNCADRPWTTKFDSTSARPGVIAVGMTMLQNGNPVLQTYSLSKPCRNALRHDSKTEIHSMPRGTLEQL